MFQSSKLRIYFTWLCCLSVLVGILFSPFFQSMSLFGFAIAGLWEGIATRSTFKAQWRDFCRRPDYWIFGLHFFIVVLGAWSLLDLGFWLERLRIKLPFLVLPLAFFFMPKLSTRYYWGLLYAMIGLLTVTSLGILINYLLHFEAIQLMLKQGQAMPMPSDNHIRFSLLVAIGIISAGYLWWQGYYWKKAWERYLIAGMGLFLFAFLHILSVRSGLAALYLALLVLGLRYAWVQKRYALGLGVVLAIGALPILGYILLPSFKMKVDYAIYDLRMRQNGQGAMLSDSERLTTLRVGWKIFKESPILGVGAGNLDQVVNFQYLTHYPQAARVMIPHNQFVYVAAGSGLFGLTLFCIALFLPLIYRQNYRDVLFLGSFLIIFASLMVEATFENSMGVALSTFFLLMGLKQIPTGSAGARHLQRSDLPKL